MKTEELKWGESDQLLSHQNILSTQNPTGHCPVSAGSPLVPKNCLQGSTLPRGQFSLLLQPPLYPYVLLPLRLVIPSGIIEGQPTS